MTLYYLEVEESKSSLQTVNGFALCQFFLLKSKENAKTQELRNQARGTIEKPKRTSSLARVILLLVPNVDSTVEKLTRGLKRQK